MPEDIQRMVDYSQALGAVLSSSPTHFYDPDIMGNGNVTDTSLIDTKKES